MFDPLDPNCFVSDRNFNTVHDLLIKYVALIHSNIYIQTKDNDIEVTKLAKCICKSSLWQLESIFTEM